MLALPIFPASHPASIVGGNELNFCVRDGNRWTLTPINTNYEIAIHLENRTSCKRAVMRLARQSSLHSLQIVGQALGLLVSVSCTHYCAYTPDLSTS